MRFEKRRDGQKLDLGFDFESYLHLLCSLSSVGKHAYPNNLKNWEFDNKAP
jgi:hypothetical protein